MSIPRKPKSHMPPMHPGEILREEFMGHGQQVRFDHMDSDCASLGTTQIRRI